MTLLLAVRIRGGHGLDRIFPGNAVVKGLDGFHIGGNVSDGVDHRPDAANLAPVVEKAEHDRNARAAGDVIEARFPLDDMAARSGRCDG